MGLITFALVLAFLLIFILQNTRTVEISYFTARGQLPLAVAMLFSAVGGVLLAAIAGSLRIWQLRRNVRRNARR
ncbi:MAG: lipopolysaccharide assembly protein LapA domain-containing protein [Actinomycetota bacterium]|nr:lipopolysaccharide assembly protein LapA domain-containing protein [Actinomycetota bacterium]